VRLSFFLFCFAFVIPSTLFFFLDLRMLIHTVIDKYVRGVYAITVKGRIPEDVEQVD
jgi:hypothetical protein